MNMPTAALKRMAPWSRARLRLERQIRMLGKNFREPSMVMRLGAEMVRRKQAHYMESAPARQLCFAESYPHPAWATRKPPTPPVVTPELSTKVRRQTRSFEGALVSQGIVRSSSARTYRKALECVCKQAHRFLGRPLLDISELYDVDLIAAVAGDDEPFDQRTPQLSRYTMRQRRVVLSAYLRAVGVPSMTFEDGSALLGQGFRGASQRRGYRYVIGAGRPELREPYRPPLEDIARFLAGAESGGNAFAGPRLAGAVALALWHGLRSVSVLKIDGDHFRTHRGDVFLSVREKAVKGKAEIREIQLRPQVIRFLERYIDAHNSYAARMGWTEAIAFGRPGPFFKGLSRRRWTYDSLRAAYKRHCQAMAVRPFAPHALRHVYACGMAAVLTLEEAAAAGGWKNPVVFMRNYARSTRQWKPAAGGRPPAIRLERPGSGPDREHGRVGEHGRHVART